MLTFWVVFIFFSFTAFAFVRELEITETTPITFDEDISQESQSTIQSNSNAYRSTTQSIYKPAAIQRRQTTFNKEYDFIKWSLGQPWADSKLRVRIQVTQAELDEATLTCKFSMNFVIIPVWTWTSEANDSNPSHKSGLQSNNQNLIWCPLLQIEMLDNRSYNFANRDKDNCFRSPGSILYHQTITLAVEEKKFETKRSFDYYPGDTHTCQMSVAVDFPGEISYEIVQFQAPVKKQLEERSVEFLTSIQTRVDKMESLRTRLDKDKGPRKFMSIDGFFIQIVAARKLGYNFLQVYLPSGFFAIVGMLSMLLPLEIAAERVALCTATLLTLTTFVNTAGEKGPKVSYIRAIDVWLMGCIGFVFFALFENILILKITAKKLHRPSRLSSSTKCKIVGAIQDAVMLRVDADKKQTSNSEEKAKDDPQHYFRFALITDRICRVVIALAFILCNIAYWNVLYWHENSQRF